MSEETAAAPAGNAQNTAAPAPVEQQAQTQTNTEQTPGAENAAAAGTAEAPETASADGEPQAGTEGESERKRNNVPARERIQQLAARAKAAEADRDRALAALQQTQQRGTQAAGLDPLNFATDAEYQAALIRATVAESVNAARVDIIRQQAEAAEYQRQTAVGQAWTESSTAFAATAPDFQAVALNPNLPVTPVMGEAIQMSEHGPQVLYYLGKNPGVAQSISELPPLQAALAIGQLSERLGVSPARKTTTAPPPPKTLTGHGSTPVTDPGNMTMAQYEKWVNKGRPS